MSWSFFIYSSISLLLTDTFDDLNLFNVTTSRSTMTLKNQIKSIGVILGESVLIGANLAVTTPFFEES